MKILMNRIKTELRNIPENLFITHDVVDKEHITNILDITKQRLRITKQRLDLCAPCGTNFNIFLLHLDEHQKYGNLTLQPPNTIVYALQFTIYVTKLFHDGVSVIYKPEKSKSMNWFLYDTDLNLKKKVIT